jgi:hypothetical protein
VDERRQPLRRKAVKMDGEILTGHRPRRGDGIGCGRADHECARAGMAVVAMRIHPQRVWMTCAQACG